MDEGQNKDGGEKGPDSELSESAKSMRAAQPWMDALWKLINGAVVGVVGGWLLDKYAGTSPWGIVGLSTLGIAVGFYGFIRSALRLGKK